MNKKIFPLLIIILMGFRIGFGQNFSISVADKSFPTIMKLNPGNIDEFIYEIKCIGDSAINGIYFSVAPLANIQYLSKYYITNSPATLSTFYDIYTYPTIPIINSYTLLTSSVNLIDASQIHTLTGYDSLTTNSVIYLHLPFEVINCNTQSGYNTVSIDSLGYKWDSAQKIAEVQIQSILNTNISTTANILNDSASFCYALNKDTTEIGFKVYNSDTTSEPAPYADSVRVYLYCTQGVSSLDINSFRINGISVTPYVTTYTISPNIMYLVDLTKVPAGLHGNPFGNNTVCDISGGGFADQLAAINSFEITATEIYDTLGCPAYPTCGGTLSWNMPGSGVTFNNECNSLTHHLYLLLPSDSLSVGADYNYYSEARPSSMSVPSDVRSLAPEFNATVCPAFTQSWTPYGTPSFHFDCPNADYQLILPLPNGYHLDSISPMLRLHYNDDSHYHSSIYTYLTMLTASPIGGCNGLTDTLTDSVYVQEFYSPTDYIVMNFGQLPITNCGNNYTAAYNLSCFNVPLILDCNQISGYNNNPDNFSYTFQYVCDTAGCSGCAQQLSCANAQTRHHCPGDCGPGGQPSTYFPVNIQRTNLGFKNQNIALKQYYSTCDSVGDYMALADTVKNDTILNLQAAYPGDQVQITANGAFDTLIYFNNYSSRFLQTVYTPYLENLHASGYTFELDPTKISYFTITGCVGVPSINGMPLILPVTSTIYTSGPSVGVMNFSVDDAIQNSALSQWDSLLHHDNIEENINVKAVINLRVTAGSSLSPFSNSLNPLNLRTQFMLVSNPGDTISSCDSWGDKFNIYQPSTSFGQGSNIHVGCTNTIGISLTCLGADYSYGVDDFPYEFRPYALYDSVVTLVLPPGYFYDNSTFQISVDNFDSSGYNYFDPGFTYYNSFFITPYSRTNMSNNPALSTVITFKGLDSCCFPAFDEKSNGNNYPQATITVGFSTYCSVKDTSEYYVYSGAKVGTQQSDPAFQYSLYDTTSGYFIHVNPILQLRPPITVDDSSNTITFEFQLCDSNNSYPIGDAWFAIQNFGSDSLLLSSATLENVSSHSYYPPIPYTDSTKGVIFNIGPINPSGCVTLLLTATIDSLSKSCPRPIGIGHGVLNIFYGSVCGNIITRPDSACEDRLDTFGYDVYKTFLQLTNTDKVRDSVSICNGGLMIDSITIHSGELGTVSDPTFWFIPQPGVVFDSARFIYPCGSSHDTLITVFDTISVPPHTIDVSGIQTNGIILDDALHINGLPGTLDSNSSLNTICGVVYLTLNCNYNKDSIKFYVSGKSTCDLVITDSAFVKPIITDTSCCKFNCWADKKYDMIIKDTDAKSLHTPALGIDTILIDGVFTVDTTFKFHGCDIEFTPGSYINIINSDTLTIEGSPVGCSHLHAACDTLWRGIFINPKSYLIVFGQTLIEDADSAIVAINSGTNQGIYQSRTFAGNPIVFNKNYKDIVVTPTWGTYAGYMDTCIFTCRNFSKAEFCDYHNWQSLPIDTILPPWSKPYTYMGMDIRQVNSIKINGIDTFDNMQYGIKAYGSNLQVYNEEFQNIGFTTSSGAGVLDTGKYFLYNTLTVGTTGLPNSFINCYNGVFLTNWLTNVNVEFNTFNNSVVNPGALGIYVADMAYPFPSPNTLNIEENKITNYFTGIQAAMNNNVTANINYNFIQGMQCSSIPWVGISVNELLSKNAIYTIDSNKINVLNYGIVTNGLQNSTIDENDINLGGFCPPVFLNGVGILVDNSDSSQIGCNVIAATSIGNGYAGIMESQSIGVSIINNSTNFTNAHIWFNSVPYLSDNLWTNNLNTGNFGVLCTSGAMVSAPMGVAGDATEDVYTGIVCEVGVPPSLIYWFSSPPPGTCTPYVPFPTSKLPNPCTLPPPPPSIKVTHSMSNKGNDSIASNIDSNTIVLMENTALSKISFTELQDTNMALAKEGTLYTLWRNQYLLNNAILKRFNDSMSKTPMGQILAIDTNMMSSSPNINYSSLLARLNAIVPSNNIEANLQTAACCYLNYRLNDSLNSNQLAILRTLADKCPDWDGNGVYEGRSLLSLFDHSTANYSDSCDSHRNKAHRPDKKNGANQTTEPTFSLHPNPNNGNFTLEYNLGEGEMGKIILFNTMGEKLGEYTFIGSEGKMDISNPDLSNGVYIWKLYSNAHVIKYGKVIIIK